MSRAPGFALTLALSTLLLVASFLLSRAAKNDELFGDYYTALIVVSVAGIGLLAILTALQVWRLIGQFRARTLGSRLTLRFVGTFTILTLVPLAVVYYFAVQFLSRSIDSWFDLQIEQTLDDAMLLGRSTLETIKLDVVHRARQDARRNRRGRLSLSVVQPARPTARKGWLRGDEPALCHWPYPGLEQQCRHFAGTRRT